MTGPFELLGDDDGTVCVDGVCALPAPALPSSELATPVAADDASA